MQRTALSKASSPNHETNLGKTVYSLDKLRGVIEISRRFFAFLQLYVSRLLKTTLGLIVHFFKSLQEGR